jgi:hypothetical protein
VTDTDALIETSSPTVLRREAIQPETVDDSDWAGFDEIAPNRRPNKTSLGPCARCRAGNHTCTGVGCYRCRGDHRGYGVASGSDGMAGGSAPGGRLHREKRRR